jgi:simple sugar transport system permease protein
MKTGASIISTFYPSTSVNIALEGTLLVAALTSVAVAHATGSALLGAIAGVASGAVVGLILALLVLRGRIDAIVTGIALNLIAAGGTRFVLRGLYGSSSNSPTVAGFQFLEGKNLFVQTVLDPTLLATLACIAGGAILLQRTRFGLRLRACGEDPTAAHAVGIPVARVRTMAVTLGGAMAGLGGTALAYDLHQFQAGMSGGRGFIALAAVIVSGWRPWRAAGACLVFAALDALQIVLQNQTHIPTQLLSMLPFVASLVALVLVRARRAPAGMGKHPASN